MGLIKAAHDSFFGTLADQWKEVVTPAAFEQRTAVTPGILKSSNRGRGTNAKGSENVISDGSKVLIPENVAAVILRNGEIIETEVFSGLYEFRCGQDSIFDGNKASRSIFRQTLERFSYGGVTPDEHRVCFVNLRELTGIRFGTTSPLVFHDEFYCADLEVLCHGVFSLKVTDPSDFMRRYVPPGVVSLDFDNPDDHGQLRAELLQSLASAISSMSGKYRLPEIQAHAAEIAVVINDDKRGVASWPERFGLLLTGVALMGVEYSPTSKAHIVRYASTIGRSNSGDIAIEAPAFPPQRAVHADYQMAQGAIRAEVTDNQVATLKRLKELLDCGVLTQTEFDARKRQVLDG